MHREGCTNPNGPTARQTWREVYRQFRNDARALPHIRAALIEFRGFAETTKRQVIPDAVMFDENPNAGIVQPFPRGRW